MLGRAPDNFEEMRDHSAILDKDGFEADIDSYLDSDEYQTAFGETIVPYYRGYHTQPGQSMLEFTNMLQLLRSASSSDKDLATRNKPQLTRSLILNSPYGKLKVRDANDILAELAKSQPSGFAPTQSWSAMPDGGTYSTLQQRVQEQAQVIQQLQQQLADLRPLAAIGAAQIKSDWQPPAVPAGGTPSTFLQQQVESQAAQITVLQEQLADARRYATIAEARLNKWRSRVFNG